MSKLSELDRKRNEKITKLLKNKETIEKQKENQKKEQTYTWENKKIWKHQGTGKQRQAFN